MTAMPAASMMSIAAASDPTVTTTSCLDIENVLRHASRSHGRKSLAGNKAWVFASLLVVFAMILCATSSSSSPSRFAMTRFMSSSSSLFGPVGARLSASSSNHPIEAANSDPSSLKVLSFSPLLLVTGAGSHGLLSIRRDALVSLLLKPMVVELGAVVLCQAVGLPLLSKLGLILRRMRTQGSFVLPHGHHLLAATRGLRTVLARRFPPAARRVVVRQARVVTRQARVVTTRTGKAWKTFGHVYKQTSLSKIVNRGKKLLKVFVVHHDLHDDEEEE